MELIHCLLSVATDVTHNAMGTTTLHLSIAFMLLAALYNYVSCVQCPPDPPHPRMVTRLRQNLFCDYDRGGRPVKEINQSLGVHFQIIVNNIDMDEYSQHLLLEGRLQLHWIDFNLRWNPKDYGDIMVLGIEKESIWEPDLTLNAYDATGGEADLHSSACVITFSGEVTCIPPVNIRAPCEQIVRRWPYDIHNCSFSFSSFKYFESHLNLTSVKLETKRLHKNQKWDILETNAFRRSKNFSEYVTNAIYPYAQYNFVLRRHTPSLVAAVVLPSGVMLVLILATFWMGAMTSTRIIINGFIILGHLLFLNTSLYTIPSNGDDIPVILVLYREGLVLAVFAILTAVAVKTMLACSQQPPGWITTVTDKLEGNIAGRILLITRDSEPLRDDEAAIIDVNAKTQPWSSCASLFDRFAFILTLITCFVLAGQYVP